MTTLAGALDGATLLARLKAGELPDERGRFGPFGGRYVPEILVAALDRLTTEAKAALADESFVGELTGLLSTSSVGRRPCAKHRGSAKSTVFACSSSVRTLPTPALIRSTTPSVRGFWPSGWGPNA